MNQRRLSRNCNNNEQPIQESRRDNEQESDDECPQRYSRYDPKELRDAARILSPFLRLTDEVNNPYARLVAKELCDTFHSLFYPGQHPVDVMKSFRPLLMSQKSLQMWNEFWLYTPGSRCKEWVPLCKESLVDISDECDPCPPQDDCGPSNQQQCPGSENFIRRRPNSNDRNRRPTQNCNINEPQTQTRQYPEYDTFEDMNNIDPCGNLLDVSPPDGMFDDSYENLCDVSPPDDMCDYNLPAGSDPLSDTENYQPDVQNATYSPFLRTGKQKNYSILDSEYIQDEVDNIECSTGRHIETCLYEMSEETNDENETCNSTMQQVSSNRQRAGNDIYLPYCQPQCSRDPDYSVPDYVENPAQFNYYRVSGSSPSSRQNANNPNALQIMSRPPVQPELRTNALDDECADNDECDDSDSGESVVSVNEIECKAKMVANAFTTLSLAQQEVDRKKNAFDALTRNYLKYMKNPIESTPPGAGTKSTKQMLRAIYKNPPKSLEPFDTSEWNDNCFRDKEFVRLLPFYEIVHNQLEYVANTQRDYGINMLDDIMSVFYHIHYDLGDPRLKNELLIEHVKLVTRNTWESFFYPGNQKMPAIPEKPEIHNSPSPLRRSVPQHLSPIQPLDPTNLSPIQLQSRHTSPRPPNQVPPALRQVSPMPPRQETPPSSAVQTAPRREQQPRPCTTANRRPQEQTSNRAPDVPQPTENPCVATKSK